MSKAVKRKVSVELQQKPSSSSSKSRLSVFQRLGTKKSKSISITDDLKQTLSAAVSITTKPISSLNKPDTELEDADPDILEKKRQEIQKELELQMKMESRRAAALHQRKRKRAPSDSSSSSSSSDSESSSSSSSSSSSDDRHKSRKMKAKRRDSSSSSDEYAKKVKKRLCQSKKEALKLHKSSKKHQIVVSHKSKRRSTSPMSKKHRSDSSSAIMMSPTGQKVIVKSLKISSSAEKHHRLREKEIERSELLQKEKEREKERERLRLREEQMRSRSPKLQRSRTPKREFSKQRSPMLRRSTSKQNSRHRLESVETERREKERREALLRCQERQRERERLAKEDKGTRLLPRPAERAMALAAAQECRVEKEPFPNTRSYNERTEPFDHRRHPKDARDHDRSYTNRHRTDETLRDNVEREYDRRDDHQSEYQRTSTSYLEERQRSERDWHDETAPKEMYERSNERRQSGRAEWDHKHRSESLRENYPDRKDWTSSSETTQKWENRKNSSWQQDSESNWNSRYKDDSWQDSPTAQPSHHNRSIGDKPNEHANSSGSASKPLNVNRRWNSWRGRGRGNHHHNDFRRSHHHTEILEERGEIYRRHINPQGASATKTSTPTKGTETQTSTSAEKTNEDTAKSANVTNPDDDGEEIADDLSEISDEADDILGQQEESQAKPPQIDVSEIKQENEELDVSTTPTTKAKPVNDTEIEKPVDEAEVLAIQDHLSITKSEENDRSKDLCDDIDLDFEEISDGELEEEARIKGLGDALGVDWASLVEESKAILREKLSRTVTSTRQRWHPNQILLDVGISYKMAGSAFAQQTLIAARQSVKTGNIKKEIDLSNITENDVDIEIKTEIDSDGKPVKLPNGIHDAENKSAVSDQILMLHPLPCAQVSAMSTAECQRRLIFNATGPYSRGLSIKRDIAMRRQLCHLATNESNCKVINTKSYSHYENVALNLFQKALEA